jgi:hypothetical protein
MIQLPWPKVELGEITEGLELRLKEEELKAESKWAVGIKYIDGFQIADWPKNSLPTGSGFDKINAQHIKKLFGDSKKYNAFYGKSVFDNWVLMEDTKYDTLGIDQKGFPIFFDGSITLGGLEWEAEKLRWEDTRIDFHHSPYLQGILTDRDQFATWIERIEAIEENCIEKIFTEIPREWGILEEYLSACITFLASSRENFAPLFRYFVEWVFLMYQNSGHR